VLAAQSYATLVRGRKRPGEQLQAGQALIELGLMPECGPLEDPQEP